MEETLAAVPTDTTPDVPTTDAATVSDTPTEDTTPPSEEQPTAAAVPTLAVRFRHQDRELSMEEATGYAQMGLKYESLQPTLDKLRMMAAGRGQRLEEFVSAWAAAEEQNALEQLTAKTGGDREVAAQLWALETSRRQQSCSVEQEEQQHTRDLNSRLAAEYRELKEVCPEVDGFEAIPEGVLRDAADNGRHLLDAYLRHWRRESRRIEENERNGQAAAAAGIGKLADAPDGEGHDAATAAMLRAVRSVFT